MPKDDKEVAEGGRKRNWVPLIVAAIGLIAVVTGFVALMSVERGSADPRYNSRLISELDRACEYYCSDYGSYPWPNVGEVTATTEIKNPNVYRALRGKTGGKRDYLCNVLPRHLKGDILVDTWGHEIIFRVNPKDGSAVIWSCGHNGKDETNTGASPDTAKLPKTYYLFRGSSTGDDIASE